MNYTAWPSTGARPVLWVITEPHGYLYCVRCMCAMGATGREVRQGAATFGSDNCDRCGKAVGESACGEIMS